LRIDAQHSYSERYPLAHLETILKRNRFEGSILCGPLIDTPDFIRGIIVPVEEWSDACLDHPKFRGVQASLIPTLPDPFFDSLARRRIPVDVAGALAEIPRLAECYPDLPIAIGHLGAPAAIEAAARYPQVCCKLSGLDMFPEPRAAVQHALRAFGPSRLMFASNWPNGLPQYTWKATLALFTQSLGAQSIEVREQILGGTAARFYGI
jgi:L-fuconolactonase